MYDRLLSSLVALSLAFLVWLYARSRNQETMDNVPIPVQLSLAGHQAEDYELEVIGPCQILVSFMGTPSRLRGLRSLLQQDGIKAEVTLTVPEEHASDSRYVEEVRVDPADIHAPSGVTPLVAEGRNRVQVCLHRLVERRLAVRFAAVPEERVGQVSIEPANALVRGPREVLDHIRFVPTQPYPVVGETEETPQDPAVRLDSVPLVRELRGHAIRCTPGSVRVQYTLLPPFKSYELTDVPVRFLCPENFPLRPEFSAGPGAGKISLRVKGPTQPEAPRVVAYIDLTSPGRKLQPGLYAAEPVEVQLPQGFDLAQEPPRAGLFQLLPTRVRAQESGDRSQESVIKTPDP
jgi:hypothetical protein